MGFDLPDKNQSLDQYLNFIDEDMLEDIGTNKEMIYASYNALHGQLEEEPIDILLKPGETNPLSWLGFCLR